MLINNKVTNKVEFVSYTGKYPNLCSGVLTLLINGKECKFGYSSREGGDEEYYPRFWTSGGRVYFTHGWRDEHVEHGEWEIDVESLAEEFWDVAPEIDRVFNENVPYGCCGGCL